MTGLLQAGDVVAPGESQPGHVVVVGVLVAKQQARRKPKGAKKRDEQSEWCVREREGKMKAGLQIRAASDVTLLSQFPNARCCLLLRRMAAPSVSLSIISLFDSFSLLSPVFFLSVHLLCPSPQPLFSPFSDENVFFNMSHQITHSPLRNCKCKI